MSKNKWALIIGMVVLIGAFLGMKNVHAENYGKPYLEYYECGYTDMCQSHNLIALTSVGSHYGENFSNKFEAFVQGYKDAFDVMWADPWGSWEEYNKASEDGTIDGMYHDMEHITERFKEYFPD